MSSAPVEFFNETGSVLLITPIGNSFGTLTLVEPPLNPGPGGPFLPNEVFSFTVVGHVATCSYATNAGGFVSTVLADIIAAFNADPVMSLLAVASPLGTATLPDGQSQSWFAAGAVNIVLGLKGMKVYHYPPSVGGVR